jgi:hypothetical protein
VKTESHAHGKRSRSRAETDRAKSGGAPEARGSSAGSLRICARGEATAESDLDFVVEFSDKSFDAYMDLKIFLENLFQCRVDLVTVSSIKPRLLPIIQRETAYASGF